MNQKHWIHPKICVVYSRRVPEIRTKGNLRSHHYASFWYVVIDCDGSYVRSQGAVPPPPRSRREGRFIWERKKSASKRYPPHCDRRAL
jgi:hypothetical protein